MGQKSRFKKFDRGAISQNDINKAFLGKLPDGLKARVSDNIKAQNAQMTQMLKGFAESFNGLDLNTEPQASDREIGYFFIQGFLTIDMRLDFFAIANDFFTNCPGICKTFNDEYYDENLDFLYGKNENDVVYFPNAEGDWFKIMILHYIYRAAVDMDNDFCKKQLLYLYRTYYKKEYNQIKRFSEITLKDILGILGDTNAGSIARIIVMARFMGKTVRPEYPDGRLLQLMHKDFTEHTIAEQYDFYEPVILEESLDESRDHMSEAHDMAKKYMKKYKSVIEESKVPTSKLMFRYFALRERKELSWIADRWREDNGIVEKYIGYAIALAMSDPEYDYDFLNKDILTSQSDRGNEGCIAEMMFMAFVCYLSNELLCAQVAETLDTSFLFSTEPDVEVHYKGIEITAEDSNETDNAENTQESKQNEELASDLEAEIKALKSKIKMQETEISSLREENKKVKDLQEELEKEKQENADDKKELAALRTFVHELDGEDNENNKTSIDEMKRLLSSKKVTIIGGHQNLVNYLKQEFPDWTYTATEVRSDIPLSKLLNQDITIFCAEHICHAFYYKYLHMARKNDLKIGYIQGSNVEQIITQIYGQI